MIKKNQKILTSKDEIKSYLGDISNHLFKKYVERGMPARYEDNRWIAHVDNIDDFFRAYTRVNMKNVPDEILINNSSEDTS